MQEAETIKEVAITLADGVSVDVINQITDYVAAFLGVGILLAVLAGAIGYVVWFIIEVVKGG